MPTFYGAIDLAKNELRNAVMQNLGSAPATPVLGQMYYNTADGTLYYCTNPVGPIWTAAKAGAGVTPASSVTTQAVGDSPVVGVGTNFAREDHKHGREAFGVPTAQTTFGLASANGSAATIARSDHAHGTPAAPVVLNPATTVTTSTVLDSSVIGVATTYAREDHKHGREGFGSITAETTYGTSKSDGAASFVAHSDHAHGNPAHTDVQHSAIHLNALMLPNGSIDMNGFSIFNLGQPITAANQVVDKGYVDNAVMGLSWKDSVHLATTVNVALTGLQTIDGVVMNNPDRVLVKNQTTPSENGIWVTGAGGWTRAVDADAAAEVQGMAMFVEDGTVNGDTAWVCTTNAPITVGTTSLAFAQFAGGGTVTGGAGMTQTGNILNVVAGDTTLTVAADDVRVNTGVIATVASLASYVPTTRNVVAGAGMTGGGALSADATLNVIAGDTSLTVAADSVVVNTAVIATVASLASYVPTSRTVSTTAPLTGGGALSGNLTLDVSNFTSGAKGTVPASGGGTTAFLRADGTWAAPIGGVVKFAAALTGTASPETITHNLNTRDIQLTVLNGATPYTAVEVDWDATTVNTAVIRYNPNLGAGYRVVVMG